MRQFIFLCFFLILSSLSLAQTSMKLEGFVKNSFGEPVPFVTIHNLTYRKSGQTDQNGYYRIPIVLNAHNHLEFTHVGYERLNIHLTLNQSTVKRYDILMKESVKKLSEVEIRDHSTRNQNFTYIDPKLSATLPSVSGSFESFLKTFPGVSSNNELSSQYNVRGGNFDENLIYVDDIEIIRPFLSQQGQQEGLSFINPELSSGVKFSTGGYGAEYGDKMSSVLDVTYKHPIAFGGSASISLLGAALNVEGVSHNHRFSYLAGFRQRSLGFILKNQDTKGNYEPSFQDFQADFHYRVSKHSELSLLTYLAFNRFDLNPLSRQTNYGTLFTPMRLDISFTGHERDRYVSGLAALAYTWQPTDHLKLKWIASGYRADEQLTRDVDGLYTFSRIQSDPSGGSATTVLKGLGEYVEHARNFLNMNVFTLEHKASLDLRGNFIKWGLRYQHQHINNSTDEYSLSDSAGYSQPNLPASIGFNYIYNSANHFSTNRYSAFVQDQVYLTNSVNLTAGVRSTYLDISKQLMFSPRATLALHPNWKTDVTFRLAAGLYMQPPFYNEYFNYDGTLTSNLKAQRAVHYVASSDWHLHALGTSLSFLSELYYKQLTHLIPYEINDVSIRYLTGQNSHGYATGLDMRLSGQFVRDLESSFSLSLQKTAEKIDGLNSGYIPRPTDQRANFAVFFQDKLSTDPTYKVHMSLIYGSRLPFGPPDHIRSEDTLRFPAYRRVDIGFSKEWLAGPGSYSSKYIKSIVLYAEVFNLLNIDNTISYLWLKDVNGNRYAVPNYLTSRQINLKLLVRF